MLTHASRTYCPTPTTSLQSLSAIFSEKRAAEYLPRRGSRIIAPKDSPFSPYGGHASSRRLPDRRDTNGPVPRYGDGTSDHGATTRGGPWQVWLTSKGLARQPCG